MSIQSTPPEFYTAKQVAELLQVSVDTVIRRFEHQPGVLDLGSPTIGRKRRYKILRIPRSALNKFIAKVGVQ